MRLIPLLTSLLLLLPQLLSCRGGGADDIAVPRPRAFARIDLYDSTYVAIDSLPVIFEVNAGTVTTLSRRNAGDIWADVAYPAYCGVLHVTFTHVTDSSTRSRAVNNRVERMALNLGSNRAGQISLRSPGGFSSEILLSRYAGVMPVQFLSVGNEWVVSGAFTFNAPSENADSILPVVNAVAADVIHISQTIRLQP